MELITENQLLEKFNLKDKAKEWLDKIIKFLKQLASKIKSMLNKLKMRGRNIKESLKKAKKKTKEAKEETISVTLPDSTEVVSLGKNLTTKLNNIELLLEQIQKPGSVITGENINMDDTKMSDTILTINATVNIMDVAELGEKEYRLISETLTTLTERVLNLADDSIKTSYNLKKEYIFIGDQYSDAKYEARDRLKFELTEIETKIANIAKITNYLKTLSGSLLDLENKNCNNLQNFVMELLRYSEEHDE